MIKRTLFQIVGLLMLAGCASTGTQNAATSGEDAEKLAALKYFETECEHVYSYLPDFALDACVSLSYSHYELQKASALSGGGRSSYSSGSPASGYDTTLQGDSSGKVYRASECIGAVVNGTCHGAVIDTQRMRPRCHGTMIGGSCTGPQF
jgi:hypothetical protein